MTPVLAADCVLLDFDGPICRLFAKHPATDAARALGERLRRQEGFPRPDLLDCRDPHAILREAALDPLAHTPELCRDLDDLLTQEELTAAASATLTEGAADLVADLLDRGARLAVVSNNNAEAVRQCLLRFDLLDAFEERIFGRPSCGLRMKPDPALVTQAVTALGVSAERCLMIGDSAADVGASRAAGVRFLGYARNRRKADVLEARGAEYVATLADVKGWLSLLT